MIQKNKNSYTDYRLTTDACKESRKTRENNSRKWLRHLLLVLKFML